MPMTSLAELTGDVPAENTVRAAVAAALGAI
ncbi:hypothetical protein H4W33_002983 [Kibdelosporangium phytohabitans]|nr:hypothetical protein [Kibdelosporangium phytohabitans]